MYYLQVEHTNDDDFDLFKFFTLTGALKYISDNKLEGWILCDFNDKQYEENDYTMIGDGE
jgi:hypothetical protein